MKNVIKSVLFSILLLGMGATANALTDCIKANTCEYAPPGSAITASPSGAISWSGLRVSQVVHFKQDDTDGTGWQTRRSVPGTSFTLPDVANQGGRFQLILTSGKWLFMDCHGKVGENVAGDVPNATLRGVGVECGDPRGGALGISGTVAHQGKSK